MFILGLKSWFLAEKSDFCLMTPNFVNDPFVVLGETVHFPPWDRFFDFFVPTWPTHQKSLPPSPLWGHRLPITALALSAGWIIDLDRAQIISTTSGPVAKVGELVKLVEDVPFSE